MDKFAIYFPQFYSTKTNDVTWGKGFTDWHLVSYANVHEIWRRRAPRRGYYEGNSIEIINNQIEEALRYGISGFAVYHYYFDEGTELDFVENHLLESNQMSWFIIWANEDWSKRWVGDHTIIRSLSRDPDEDFIRRHVDLLIKRFNSENYYRVEGRPLFVIYNLSHFHNPSDVISTYRRVFAELNLDPYVVGMIKSKDDFNGLNILDGAYLFEPRYFYNTKRLARGKGAAQVLSALRKNKLDNLANGLLKLLDTFQQRGETYSWNDFLVHMNRSNALIKRQFSQSDIQWILSPGWNNAPRYGSKFTELQVPDREELQEALSNINAAGRLPVIINAWNEWSEGAAIEPCHYIGDELIKTIQEYEF